MPIQNVITSAKVDQFVKYMGEGVFVETACRAVGWNRATYYRWMKEARSLSEAGQIPDTSREGLIVKLAHEVPVAESEVERRVVNKLLELGMAGDSKVLMWFLERRFPQKWGRMRDRLLAEEQVLKLLSMIRSNSPTSIPSDEDE